MNSKIYLCYIMSCYIMMCDNILFKPGTRNYFHNYKFQIDISTKIHFKHEQDLTSVHPYVYIFQFDFINDLMYN